jgi:hypothetical protein
MKQVLIYFLLLPFITQAQDYFYGKYVPFDPSIPTPAQFLEHEIGERHTRHDQMLWYFKKLAELSDKATFMEYGKSHEGRPLTMLIISHPDHLRNLKQIQSEHLSQINADPKKEINADLPVIINMGYSVHGNEPSTSEAALLTAYTLVASQNAEIQNYLKNAVIFIDPVINPDGRERHSLWANMHRSKNLVADKFDTEHNEFWPRGRGNHYWFDLNRDWLLAIHPESRAKLEWYHQWYPNVIGDFHEMGTNSTFFFEPMKTNGSDKPIMPKENYGQLTDVFADYFVKYLDSIGSFYFTKEVFDGTYPGYGSSYGDLQGGLALLFEQASSRGHIQETSMGNMTFAFTIRNQYVAGMATIEAATDNKSMLRKYARDFFRSAVVNASGSGIAAYSFNEPHDHSRLRAFMDKLLIHRVKVYKDKSGSGYVVPTGQPQYRMVQTFFETYNKYRDSVFYDASAWSLANFYNIKYEANAKLPLVGDEITSLTQMDRTLVIEKSDYGYLMDWADCQAAGALSHLQQAGVMTAVSFRPFSMNTGGVIREFHYGTIIIPVPKQQLSSDSVYKLLITAQKKYGVPIYSMKSGYSAAGIDAGSRHIRALEAPKVLLLIGDGVNSTEAGEVWHLMDQRTDHPITRVAVSQLAGINLDRYNTLIMVSGNYSSLDSSRLGAIRTWASKGNTVIAIGTAASHLIKQKTVREKLVEAPKKDSITESIHFAQAEEIIGKESLGGAIFKSTIDPSHPVAFGYRQKELPVYKNNTVWLLPSENKFSTVSRYAENPHIDGYISPINLNHYMKQSASVVVSPVGQGRAILFADNPNFRGTWYGTDRMFLNAVFFGQQITVPTGVVWE